MSVLKATALSVGVFAGIATWLFLSVGSILIWAAFVAWACFFHCGGDNDALKTTIVGNIFGVVAGWVAALAILYIPLAGVLTLPLWAGIVIVITVIIVVLASSIPALASIPASVYGYACAFAFLLQTPDKLTKAALVSPSFDNVLVVVIVSMVIGALFGWASGKGAGAMAKS
jgi:hypothetical protein